jgi:hypothetical protein
MKLAAAIALSLAVSSQALAAADNGFAAFWAKFAAAVAKDDGATLEKLTVLGPGLDEEDKTFAGFHAHVLDRKARNCLAVAKPKPEPGGGSDAEYSAFCGHLIFGFSRTAGGWKLTDISPDD